MADTPTTQREEDQQNQPQTWTLDSWASALSAPSQNPAFLAQAKAAYDAQHDVSWDERVAAERAELTERAERMTTGHAGRNAREALAEFNPEAELGAWAMENVLQNTPEFLDAAKADYDSIHGAGAWDAHVEATHQELKEDAEGWDIFGWDQDRLDEFDPNQMLADWGRTHILSQQNALDWSNAAAFGLDGDVFKGLDGQNPVPDETMYDRNTEFGQAWLNASEILYNAKNGENAWAERVADKGWDADEAAQELAEEGESYVSWFENNLVSAANGTLNLSEDGQVAMVYLMSLNGFTESTWGDFGGALWRGAADPTFIAATAAGALTFGAGGAAAHGGRIAAQQGIMHGIKQIMISRTATAAAARGATAALGEGMASGAALSTAEQKLAVDNDIRDGYDTGAIFVRSVTEGAMSAGFGGILSGSGRAISNNIDFTPISARISDFIGAKNGNVSPDLQRFRTLTREASEAKETGNTAELKNIGDEYDDLLRNGNLSADERALVENELAGIHAAAVPPRQTTTPDADATTDAPAAAAPAPETRNNSTAAEEPEIPVVTDTTEPRPATRIAQPGPNTETSGARPSRRNADQNARSEEKVTQNEEQVAAAASAAPPEPPTPPQPSVPRKPNGWNTGQLSEQEKASFITSIDDTTTRNAFINKLNPAERNSLMSHLPDGDILGYVNAMSDVDARSRLIQNLPAGKRDDVLDALNVSDRLNGGQSTVRNTTPEADANAPDNNNTATNNTSTTSDGADSKPTSTAQPANNQKQISFPDAVANAQNVFRDRWRQQIVEPEVQNQIDSGKLKKPGILDKDRDDLTAADQKLYDKAEKSYNASVEKIAEGLERKYDYNKLTSAYRSIAQARRVSSLDDVKDSVKNGWRTSITNALQAAVDEGWHPDEVVRLIVHARVAKIGGMVKDSLSDRDKGESLYNLSRNLPEGSYGRDLFDKVIKPIVDAQGADGSDADMFLLRLDTGRKPYGDDLEADYSATWRSGTNLKDIAKSFIPLSFHKETSLGQIARSGDPMTRIMKENFFRGARGMRVNEDGTTGFSVGRLLNNWTLNGPSLGLWNYANNVGTGTYRMGIKALALSTALGTTYVGEELVTEPLMGENLTIMGHDVDLARRAIQDPVDIADYTIGNIWAGFSDDREMNFSEGPNYVTADWANVLGDVDSSANTTQTPPNTVPHFPYGAGSGNAPSAPETNTDTTPVADGGNGNGTGNGTETTPGAETTPGTGNGTGGGNETQTTTPPGNTGAAPDINIKENLPVTLQKLMTRENQEALGQTASKVGGFFSGLATSAMGLFRNLNNMLGPTWGPVAGVVGAVLGGMLGLNILRNAKNFLTGGGIMKLGGMAALGVAGLYAFEHFSGARDAHNNEADTNARLRNTGPITTAAPAPNREVGRTTLQKDHDFTYQGAFEEMDRQNASASLSENFVGQGNGDNLPRNIAQLAEDQQANQSLSNIANVSFSAEQNQPASAFKIDDDFRATPHDSGITNTFLVTTDATGTPGIFNASDMALSGMNGAADHEYTFTAAQNGLGFDGAQIAGGTYAATGNNHLPNEFAGMINNPAAVRFDNTGHEKGQAIAANGWNTDQFTPRNTEAPANTLQEEQPVSFHSLA